MAGPNSEVSDAIGEREGSSQSVVERDLMFVF